MAGYPTRDELHPDCPHDDLIGPFEMDGRVDGQYHPTGCWWTVCRGCGVSDLVAMPVRVS